MKPPATLSILMMASEGLPFSKTGGLGDVVGALPRALAALGHRVTLVLPRYRGVPAGDVRESFEVKVGGRTLGAAFHHHTLAPGVTAWLVDCPELYDRESLYAIGNLDYPDNAFRFAFFAKAGLELAGRVLDRADVVHAHDWQTGLVPVYLRTAYPAHPVLGGAHSVFTIHNLAYQGLFPAEMMPALDLPWTLFGVEGLEYWGKISFLKAGINFSRFVTTVSPGYAREIQTPEFGFGFDGILKRRSRDLVGILNGIDTSEWDPMTDAALPVPFGPGRMAGKRAAKRAVLDAFGLVTGRPALERPLIGMVSRMVEQKGFDLLSDAAPSLLRCDATLALLGSGEPGYEAEWTAFSQSAPERVGVRIGFDERLAHLIVGGADMFLMPSHFEPCGLSQLYSLRYGTVPIVRAVGGLDNTVENFSGRTGRGTGFKFKGYTSTALLGAVRAALQLFADRKRWRAVQLAGMSRDFSWSASARDYVKVYGRAFGRPVAPG